ncbi:hypothetical protein VNO77_16101 [Canavalia gladiata]|uniref:Uncharacterized protein n=1 Tax=Canavalia gladiata TaxID=3824 RepID=A0AAN9QRT5_CANGL
MLLSTSYYVKRWDSVEKSAPGMVEEHGALCYVQAHSTEHLEMDFIESNEKFEINSLLKKRWYIIVWKAVCNLAMYCTKQRCLLLCSDMRNDENCSNLLVNNLGKDSDFGWMMGFHHRILFLTPLSTTQPVH